MCGHTYSVSHIISRSASRSPKWFSLDPDAHSSYRHQMTLELSAVREHELADLARNSERTPDELAQEAVAQFLAGQAEHREKIQRSREQIAQGRSKTNEAVFADLKRRFGW